MFPPWRRGKTDQDLAWLRLHGSLAARTFIVVGGEHQTFLSNLFGRNPKQASAIPKLAAQFSANIDVSRDRIWELKLSLAPSVRYEAQVGCVRFGDKFEMRLFPRFFLSIDSRNKDLHVLWWAFICSVDDANRHRLSETSSVYI